MTGVTGVTGEIQFARVQNKKKLNIISKYFFPILYNDLKTTRHPSPRHICVRLTPPCKKKYVTLFHMCISFLSVNLRVTLFKIISVVYYRMSFIQYLENQNLNNSTIVTHVRNLERYGAVGASQRMMVKKLDLLETWPKRLSSASSISKYLQFKQRPNDKIVAYIKNANDEIQKDAEIRQRELSIDPCLPTLKEMWEYTNSLYASAEYKSYAIMYLFLTYTVRNKDLIAKVVKSKKQTNDTENFFIVGKNQVVYLRHKYKTADKYGLKSHIIKNKKFVSAISHLNYLLQPSDNIDRVIKKITEDIGGITESTILKVVLKYSNNMNALKKISRNRGTDINTLIQNYNIT